MTLTVFGGRGRLYCIIDFDTPGRLRLSNNILVLPGMLALITIVATKWYLCLIDRPQMMSQG
jgi:hypothetical protein